MANSELFDFLNVFLADKPKLFDESTMQKWHDKVKEQGLDVYSIQTKSAEKVFIGTNFFAIRFNGDFFVCDFEVLFKVGIVKELNKQGLITENEMSDILTLIKERRLTHEGNNKKNTEGSGLLSGEYG